jgi:hypothetical protein
MNQEFSGAGTRKRAQFYYQIKFGKVVRQLTEEQAQGRDDVITRKNKNDKTVHEVYHGHISGLLVGAELQAAPKENPEYGKQINLILKADDGQKAMVSMKFDSAYARAFIFCIPNMDLSKPIELDPYVYKNKDGAERSGMSIYNGSDEKLKWAMGTKDNMNGVPGMKKTVLNGQEVWDKTDQLVFLENYFQNFCQIVNQGPDEEPQYAEPEEEEPDHITATPQEAFEAEVEAEPVPAPKPKRASAKPKAQPGKTQADF